MTDCWLTLDDDLISRYHARFRVSADAISVEDLGSRNGTFVNGERIEGRRTLRHADQVRIGREIVVVLEPGQGEVEDDLDDSLRRTMGPGEETQFPSLIGQLVDKSLKQGRVKEAERYALALTSQLTNAKVKVDHPAAQSCSKCLVGLADKTASGTWLDRLFQLYAAQGWVMQPETLSAVREALDKIPRLPAKGIRDYEESLRSLSREGEPVPARLLATIGELADAYAGR